MIQPVGSTPPAPQEPSKVDGPAHFSENLQNVLSQITQLLEKIKSDGSISGAELQKFSSYGVKVQQVLDQISVLKGKGQSIKDLKNTGNGVSQALDDAGLNEAIQNFKNQNPVNSDLNTTLTNLAESRPEITQLINDLNGFAHELKGRG